MSVLRLDTLVAGVPHDYAGKFVVSYDPDYHLPGGEYDGGNLVVTEHLPEAKVFAHKGEAIAYWLQSPTCECHRLRPDGEPNRPLSAFSMEVL